MAVQNNWFCGHAHVAVTAAAGSNEAPDCINFVQCVLAQPKNMGRALERAEDQEDGWLSRVLIEASAPPDYSDEDIEEARAKRRADPFMDPNYAIPHVLNAIAKEHFFETSDIKYR